MSTIGRVFKLKSLPMMIAAAVITSSLILLIAFMNGQVQKKEVLKSSIDGYAKTVEAELEGFIDKIN